MFFFLFFLVEIPVEQGRLGCVQVLIIDISSLSIIMNFDQRVSASPLTFFGSKSCVDNVIFGVCA